MGREVDEQERVKSFNVIAVTFYEHSEEILNFYINHSTNAAAESFNAKIKAFRVKPRIQGFTGEPGMARKYCWQR
jgi:hypothetical protein